MKDESRTAVETRGHKYRGNSLKLTHLKGCILLNHRLDSLEKLVISWIMAVAIVVWLYIIPHKCRPADSNRSHLWRINNFVCQHTWYVTTANMLRSWLVLRTHNRGGRWAKEKQTHWFLSYRIICQFNNCDTSQIMFDFVLLVSADVKHLHVKLQVCYSCTSLCVSLCLRVRAHILSSVCTTIRLIPQPRLIVTFWTNLPDSSIAKKSILLEQ